mmetsp:Transcript_6511/g.15897  ORF Transcript_6511/g.15897 Transcript_6511/m.15897 type:complete len:301 (+) Transcript_6511:59-961(+)
MRTAEDDPESSDSCGEEQPVLPPPAKINNMLQQEAELDHAEQLEKELNELPPEARRLCERYAEEKVRQEAQRAVETPRDQPTPCPSWGRRPSRDLSRDSTVPLGLESLSSDIVDALRNRRSGVTFGPNGFVNVADLMEALPGRWGGGEILRQDVMRVAKQSKSRGGVPHFEVHEDGCSIRAFRKHGRGDNRRSRSPRRDSTTRSGRGGHRHRHLEAGSVRLSKCLAKVLRHIRHEDLHKDDEGWVLLENLMIVLADEMEEVPADVIMDTVQNSKQRGITRFEVKRDGHNVHIRARRGRTV